MVPSKLQDKGKDEVPPSEVTPVQVTPVQSPDTDDDVPEVPPTGKHRNNGHYHEEGGPMNGHSGQVAADLQGTQATVTASACSE